MIFIHFLRWLGPPLPGWPCMSFSIKGGYPNVRNFWCFFPLVSESGTCEMVYFQRGKSRVPSLKNTVKFILSEPVRSPGRGVFPKELIVYSNAKNDPNGTWKGRVSRTCFCTYVRVEINPKMNIFKEGTKRWLLLLCTRGGPPDRSFVWALSEIPPILRFTKNEHFQNKKWDHDCYYSAPGGSRRPPPHMSSLGNTPDFWIHQKWHIFK